MQEQVPERPGVTPLSAQVAPVLSENEPDSLRALRSSALELLTLFFLPLSNSFVYSFLSEMFYLSKRDSLSCPAPHSESQARKNQRSVISLSHHGKREEILLLEG